jgi:hypothetical protein
MGLLTKQGYGQLEPNHLVAQRTGEIYAQLPFVGFSSIISNGDNAVENGMFLDYNYAAGAAQLPGATGGSKLTMLVFNEIRLYGPFLTNKDFALFPTPSTGLTSTNPIPGLAAAANNAFVNNTLVINVVDGGAGYTASQSNLTGGTITFSDGGSATFGLVSNASGVAVGATWVTSAIYASSAISSIVVPAPITAASSGGKTATVTAYFNQSLTNSVQTGSTTSSQQVVYPRLYKLNIGDIITTNLVGDATIADGSNGAAGRAGNLSLSSLAVGATLTVNIGGYLSAISGATVGNLYRVVAQTTTPDLQPAVKIQCIQTA